jgi:serine/threonine protein kinase
MIIFSSISFFFEHVTKFLQIPIGGRISTAAYSAPEVLARIGVDGCAADIFSTGVTLHAMMCFAGAWRAAWPGQNPPFWELFCANPDSGEHQAFWLFGKRPTAPVTQELMRRLMRGDPAHRLSIHDAHQMLDAMGNANLTCVFLIISQLQSFFFA